MYKLLAAVKILNAYSSFESFSISITDQDHVHDNWQI